MPSPAQTVTPPTAEVPWWENGACVGVDRDIFFERPNRYGIEHHDPIELALAKAFCDRCEVAADCLAFALGRGPDLYGVWGGSTKADRERLVRRIPRVKCPMCASKNLINYPVLQVCAACGHSWPTRRPVPTQPTAAAAA